MAPAASASISNSPAITVIGAIKESISVSFSTTYLSWVSLWGTVTTIVFLVFSVLALWNIDQKIQELNEIKRSIGEKFNNIETTNREVMLEADKAQREIVKEAEEQIKRILDKSTYRQNFYDTLTRIANIPDF